MPRKSNSRAAQGAGTIRKKTVTRNTLPPDRSEKLCPVWMLLPLR